MLEDGAGEVPFCSKFPFSFHLMALVDRLRERTEMVSEAACEAALRLLNLEVQ